MCLVYWIIRTISETFSLHYITEKCERLFGPSSPAHIGHLLVTVKCGCCFYVISSKESLQMWNRRATVSPYSSMRQAFDFVGVFLLFQQRKVSLLHAYCVLYTLCNKMPKLSRELTSSSLVPKFITRELRDAFRRHKWW